MCRKLILVIEDELPEQRSFNVILRSAGHRVTCSSSCCEAFDMLTGNEKKIQPDLLIADTYCSRKSKLEMLKELKKNHINIPTLVIVSDREEEMMDEFRENGFRNFLFKPFSQEVFLRQAERVLKNNDDPDLIG